ncbi:hypothetical protein Ciccas_011858 [Cichlidogyrus casuarinus]|uniref:Uncharacterized protein n=1 Tax=Cichlidogyrus casuarinus TaxID=1844966 RepID=A0ABD2PQQ5_9PLAT
MISNNPQDPSFFDFDQISSFCNQAFSPTKSISISKSGFSNVNMLVEDDGDGADLLSLIDRSLQDFNESLVLKPKSLVKDDSAYNTAASSLSNQENQHFLLAEQMHRMNLARHNISPKYQENHQLAFRVVKEDAQLSSWNNKYAAPSVQHSTQRRRLQSCTVIGSTGNQNKSPINHRYPSSYVE